MDKPKLGGVNYYASANMWTTGQKCIWGHIWPHQFAIWPDPKISKLHPSLPQSVSGGSLVKFHQQMPKISC